MKYPRPSPSMCGFLLGLALCGLLEARKFYPDDPLQAEPTPVPIDQIRLRKISDYYDFFLHTLGKPGERQVKGKPIRAGAVNTLGEPMDGAWYTKRHYYKPMTIEELVRGPEFGVPPSMSGSWTVVGAKAEGITPGFTVLDSAKRRYFVKFDPLPNPELATAADVISSKFFYALGYHVPQNYLAYFTIEQLELGEDVELADRTGKKRKMTRRDLVEVLMNVPKTADGKYRAVASVAIDGQRIGEFRYFGRRKDDPNDLVPHEHRRDLRGLSIFCAWLNHDDSRSVNTFDALVSTPAGKHVRHYLIDFGSTLGSASNGPNSPRAGGEYLFSWGTAFRGASTFGLYVPGWALSKFPNYPSVGRFESKRFNAETWVPEYPNPAFVNRLPDDEFWAAKQVMAFTDEQIRAIVKAGQYSNPDAEKWVADCLIERRDKIGKAFLTRVLPLDRFTVREGRLEFDDLGAKHGPGRTDGLAVTWARFENESERKTPLAGSGFGLPAEIGSAAPGSYFVADIAKSGDAKRTIAVHLRKGPRRVEVVGVERGW